MHAAYTFAALQHDAVLEPAWTMAFFRIRHIQTFTVDPKNAIVRTGQIAGASSDRVDYDSLPFSAIDTGEQCACGDGGQQQRRRSLRRRPAAPDLAPRPPLVRAPRAPPADARINPSIKL